MGRRGSTGTLARVKGIPGMDSQQLVANAAGVASTERKKDYI